MHAARFCPQNRMARSVTSCCLAYGFAGNIDLVSCTVMKTGQRFQLLYAVAFCPPKRCLTRLGDTDRITERIYP